MQPALDPEEQETADRYQGYRLEDERDAHLMVNIGRRGMKKGSD